MQFSLNTQSRHVDPLAIERGLLALDPAALMDMDAGSHTVRISTSATRNELLAFLGPMGLADNPADLVQLPSECCGGCGG